MTYWETNMIDGVHIESVLEEINIPLDIYADHDLTLRNDTDKIVVETPWSKMQYMRDCHIIKPVIPLDKMGDVSIQLCDEIDTENGILQEQMKIQPPVKLLPSLPLPERPTDKQFKPQYQERYTKTPLRRGSQMTIQQSFEMSASRKGLRKGHTETLRIRIDDAEKPKDRNNASNGSKQVCKPVSPIKNVSKQSTKKRKTPAFWTTFNKLPKIEAIKTEKQLNTSKNSLVNPTDNAIVTPEKKVRMFEPTSLNSHKYRVNQIGGSNNAWKTAIFSNNYSTGIQ